VNDRLRQQWMGLLHRWAVDATAAAYALEDVRQHYAEPTRFYHTLDHIADMLETIESIGSQAHALNAVKLATWLHDVIYDSRASDNEERSADFAAQMCQKLGIAAGHAVASLIMKTKTHDAAYDMDAKVLLDADLAVLGSSPPIYRKYADNIRLEYAWVPQSEYQTGRRQILSKFLTRPRIYYYLTHLEEPARRNIAAEIRQLTTA
jgi:predicted metal-dependent HD superfamily phosphohydrolase